MNIFAGPKYAQTNLRNILLQGRSRPYFIIEYSTREEPCLDFHVSGRYLVCHAILIIEATSIIFYPPLKNEKGIKIIQKPNRPSRPRRRDRKSDNSNVNSSLKKNSGSHHWDCECMLRHLFSFRCFPADLGELDRHLEHVRLLTFSPLQNSLSMFVRKFRLICAKKKLA